MKDPICARLLLAASLAASGPALAGGITPGLLLTGGWCTMSYNATTNVSSGHRIIFRRDGSYGAWYGSEMHAPALSTEHRSRVSGQWRVDAGELFINQGRGFAHVPTHVRMNSSGWPVIQAEGTEYSLC